jgi:hypothetical protein
MIVAANRHTILPIIHISLLVFIWFVFVSEIKSQEINYRAQSLYIYKFTKYIYWPEEKMQGDFLIGVFGSSPVFEELELMASLKKAGNEQDILVRDISVTDSLGDFHIVYISSSKSRQIKIIEDQIGKRPVLLVAEREGLASRGATISFLITEDGGLKFEVNVAKLEKQQMRISDELLKIGFKL